jgi:hypothetical protein
VPRPMCSHLDGMAGAGAGGGPSAPMAMRRVESRRRWRGAASRSRRRWRGTTGGKTHQSKACIALRPNQGSYQLKSRISTPRSASVRLGLGHLPASVRRAWVGGCLLLFGWGWVGGCLLLFGCGWVACLCSAAAESLTPVSTVSVRWVWRGRHQRPQDRPGRHPGRPRLGSVGSHLRRLPLRP